jgi:hypothetical protein
LGPFFFAGQVNEGERSVVSMRDIGRAARVFKWFLGGRCQSWAVLSTFFFLSGQKWAKTSEPFGNQGPHG